MLRKIGSYIGTLLMADSATSALESMDFAPMYVEVDIENVLPEYVPLMADFGQEFHQKVSYEWIPPKCTHCKVFCYDNDHCYHGGAPLRGLKKQPANRGGHRKVWRVVDKPSSGQQQSSHVNEVQVDRSIPEVVPSPLHGKIEPLVVDNETMSKQRSGKSVTSPSRLSKQNVGVEDRSVQDAVVLPTKNAFAKLEKVELHGVNCEAMGNFGVGKLEFAISHGNVSKQCGVEGKQQLKKRRLWYALCEAHEVVDDAPWLIDGDFNIVRNYTESVGGGAPDGGGMHDLNVCIKDINVMEFPHSGKEFTSSRNWKTCGLVGVLDRILCNDNWLMKYSSCSLDVPVVSESNYCSLKVDLHNNIPADPKPFKYKHFWSFHNSFKDKVKVVWEEEDVGSAFQILQSKLRKIKLVLKELHNEAFSNISGRLIEMKHKYEEIQASILNGDLSTENLVKAKNIPNDYNKLCDAESDFYISKARIRWIRDGNASTRLFHTTMRIHHNKNLITMMQNDDGEMIEDYGEVKDITVGFYKQLFSKRNTSSNCYELVNQIIDRQIDNPDFEALQRMVTMEEIEDVFLHMKGSNALGPDGFTLEFFKDTWSTTRNSVLTTVHSFFITGHMPRFINCTSLTLIPKVKYVKNMRDFRPISCCNVIYKIIFDLLVRRLKLILHKIVGPHQTTYVPGRHISDGILLIQELMNGYHSKSGRPRCILKIDIMKAYDSVDWDFMWCMLHKINLPGNFISWIKACVTTPWFFVNLNDSNNGFFQSTRGLRQGDPLSPYLFIIVMEFFDILLQHFIKEEGFDYHPFCRDIKLTNIYFADELCVLSATTTKSLSLIKETLELFGRTTGLLPNLAKSSCFFAGVEVDVERYLCSVIGISKAQLPVKYLGVPLITK
ncbi:hypothetical protein LIER_22373 [Lithospermum erythrorhizon]|uniref:Reverse transcriptase domain-containing protein n=1 Tax=Lithospermum erythrorhizon TaxID=34254 RepID=A0AAV3QTL5_LITER